MLDQDGTGKLDISMVYELLAKFDEKVAEPKEEGDERASSRPPPLKKTVPEKSS